MVSHAHTHTHTHTRVCAPLFPTVEDARLLPKRARRSPAAVSPSGCHQLVKTPDGWDGALTGPITCPFLSVLNDTDAIYIEPGFIEKRGEYFKKFQWISRGSHRQQKMS